MFADDLQALKRSAAAAVALSLCVALIPLDSIARPGQTAQGTAQAEIVQPLSAQTTGDLEFGGVTVSPSIDGTVTIDAQTGAADYTGGARPVCATGYVCGTQAASFDIRGEADRSYIVTLPMTAIATLADGAGPSLTVSALNAVSQNSNNRVSPPVLDRNGNDTLRIGGKLLIPAGARPGRYSAEIKVVVSYD